MKAKNLSPVMRGISAAMASVLTLALTGTSVADTYRTNLDDVLGTQSYVTQTLHVLKAITAPSRI